MAREATATGVMRRFGEAFDHNGEGFALWKCRFAVVKSVHHLRAQPPLCSCVTHTTPRP